VRLLLAHNFYREEGGENSVYRALAALLREAGHEVAEYVRDSRELDAAGALAKAAAIPAGIASRRTAREVAALVARFRPQAALVQNVFPLISPAIYTTLRGLRVPVGQLVYNYRFLCPDGHLFTRGAICERCVGGSTLPAVRFACYRGSRAASAWYAGIVGWHRFWRTFARIDAFGVPDRFMEAKLAAGGLGAGRCVVLGNPFDLPARPAALASGAGLLFVGRLVPQKGLGTLLRALAAAGVDAPLTVVGDGPARGALETEARQRLGDRVRFLGPVFGEAVTALMAGSAALVVPSEWYDNAPLVVYQAFAAGLPVLASDIDGLPEVVEHEDTGLLVPPGDVAAWAAALRRACSDPAARARWGLAARERAERDFGAPAYRARVEGLLRRLAG
jgi:glycosyltransferase involved in cell wall biosynthesis